MAVVVPITGEALARGLRSEFQNTWQTRYKGVLAEMSRFAELGIASDKIEELYGYGETAPYPKRRPWGDEVQTKGWRYRNFTVENFSWDSAVEWYKHQRIFDQLKGLERDARRAGENFATLDERVIVGQVIPAATDLELLETVPNAPDGVASYNATDGDGGDRFGVSGGNIESGGGVGSSAQVREDTFDALERNGTFEDPEGQPAIDAGLLKAFTVLFPLENLEVMLEAFKQTRTVDGSATPKNVLLEGGFSITLLPTPRLTGPDYYLFLDGFEPKPFFSQVAQVIEETIQVEGNSDIARRTKREGIFWQAIKGFGSNLPLGTTKVNNT